MPSNPGIKKILPIGDFRLSDEEKLRVSEEFFRSYLEYAPDGVYVSDLEGNFLVINEETEERDND